MDKVTFKDILDPVSPDTFFKEYWGKKHLIIRRNKFKDFEYDGFNWNGEQFIKEMNS